ncbi:LysR substrate-binding domain-containing protein [Bradyrhizobium sp. INPA03-11B]|uniref:LysR substrate-binding domain-containing protein n=1 Tax=Bradyrhizobium sp. INPA03-11B TaxID=418598 RepID=UPI00338DD5C8
MVPLVTALMSAVASGLGVTLLPEFLVRSHIDRDGIAVAFDAAMDTDAGCYFVYPTNAGRLGMLLSQFRDWLLMQARLFDSVRGRPSSRRDFARYRVKVSRDRNPGFATSRPDAAEGPVTLRIAARRCAKNVAVALR